MKPCQSLGVILQRSGKELEGYDNPELKIVGAIDFAHAAAPQQRDDSIALDENYSRRESAARLRVRT